MRPPPLFRTLFAGLTLLAAGASAAEAQLATYESRSAFFDALSTDGSNDLNGFDVDNGALTTVSPITFGAPAFTDAELTGPAVFGSGLQPDNSGSNLVWIISGGTSQLTFESAVNGFGAEFVNLGSVAPVGFRFFSGLTELHFATGPSANTAEGYSGFFGITLGNAFDRVDIEADGQEYVAMDDLAAGVGLSAVPEPSTVVLFGAGGAALLLATRRRRAAGGPALRPEIDHA